MRRGRAEHWTEIRPGLKQHVGIAPRIMGCRYLDQALGSLRLCADVEDQERGGELEMVTVAAFAHVLLILEQASHEALAVEVCRGRRFCRAISFHREEAETASVLCQILQSENGVRHEVFGYRATARLLNKCPEAELGSGSLQNSRLRNIAKVFSIERSKLDGRGDAADHEAVKPRPTPRRRGSPKPGPPERPLGGWCEVVDELVVAAVERAELLRRTGEIGTAVGRVVLVEEVGEPLPSAFLASAHVPAVLQEKGRWQRPMLVELGEPEQIPILRGYTLAGGEGLQPFPAPDCVMAFRHHLPPVAGLCFDMAQLNAGGRLRRLVELPAVVRVRLIPLAKLRIMDSIAGAHALLEGGALR